MVTSRIHKRTPNNPFVFSKICDSRNYPRTVLSPANFLCHVLASMNLFARSAATDRALLANSVRAKIQSLYRVRAIRNEPLRNPAKRRDFPNIPDPEIIKPWVSDLGAVGRPGRTSLEIRNKAEVAAFGSLHKQHRSLGAHAACAAG